MVFNSETGREAQAKRKKHGTGGFRTLKTTDPDKLNEVSQRGVEANRSKYGEEYRAEMQRRANMRWNGKEKPLQES